MRPPEKMGNSEVSHFLTYLATHENVAASTQNQARNALKFLYDHILSRDIGEITGYVSAKKQSDSETTILAEEEVIFVLNHLNDTHKLMASLVFSTGMRIGETVRLRINDIDFNRQHIRVHDSKEWHYRMVPLPPVLADALKAQIAKAKNVHDCDRKKGAGTVCLPNAVERFHPKINRKFDWQYLFPARSQSVDPRSGLTQRHHINESSITKAIRQAGSDIGNAVFSIEDIRNSFICHMLALGADIRSLKEILGTSDLKKIRFYRDNIEITVNDNSNNHYFPTSKQCERLAWLNRLLRSGFTVEEIEKKRWSSKDGDYSIYCLAENGKHIRYIGITSQAPEIRLKQHMADCGRGKNVYKENWIRSCIKRSIPITIHVVRSGLPSERACMMEFELIRFFKKPFSLVNTHAGGTTGYAGLSEESKEKHRVNTEKGLLSSALMDMEEDEERH